MAICTFVCAVTVGIGGSIGSAAAQAEDDAEARDLFRRGSEALQAGRVAEACPLFEESLGVAAVPWTARNLGYCYHLAGRELEAIAVLSRILDGDFGEISEETRQRSVELIRAAEGRLARITITTDGPSEAQIRVDGEEPETTDDLPLDPGRHVVSAVATGFQPTEDVLDLAPGSQQRIELSLLPLTGREPDPESDDDVGLVLGITAGIVVLTAAIVTILILTDGGPEEDPAGVVPITEVLRSPFRF